MPWGWPCSPTTSPTPPGDYTALFQSLQQNKPFGEAVLALMRAENAANLLHYRNVVFGDPTLGLSY
jgi:hypothetical protein